MLRRASTTLFCALALLVPAYGQDVFVPRELKAIPVHPPKPKEPVRKAEPAGDVDLKPVKESAASETAKPKTAKAEAAPAKTEKAAPKEKPAPASDEAT